MNRNLFAETDLATAATLYPADGVVTLPGGNVNVLIGEGTTVYCGSGNDTITADPGGIFVYGNSGPTATLTFFGGSTYASRVMAGTASATIFGGTGGGTLAGGTHGHNILVSQGASSNFTSLAGAAAGDQLFGSASGTDVLTLGAGTEIAVGGSGVNTTINGGSGAGIIFSGAGPTTVNGGSAPMIPSSAKPGRSRSMRSTETTPLGTLEPSPSTAARPVPTSPRAALAR